VAVRSGNVNRRKAVIFALVDVAARRRGPSRRQCKSENILVPRICCQQQLEAVGVAVLGGNVDRRSAVVVALVDVAARI
jgi:hypothetical protein